MQSYTWGRLSAVVFNQGNYNSNGGQNPNVFYEYSYNQAGHVTGNRMLITNTGGDAVDEKAQYGWDDHGRMTSMTYPSGTALTYQFDAMGRTNGMTGNGAVSASATFGSNNQLLTLQYGNSTHVFAETRNYNSLLQLTHMVVGGAGTVDMQYIYNTAHNNGRVTQTIDGVLGETVNYTYDNLHRLSSATATNNTWGESYTFDGFGNLTGKTPTVGSAPAYTWSGNSASNAPGPTDGSGNAQNMPGMWSSSAFDVENRLVSSHPGDNFSYVYDPWGRRVWKWDNTSDNV